RRDEAAVAEGLALLRGSPALAEARRFAQAEVEAAKAALAPFPPGAVRAALEELADQVLDRQV
ncbi:MAG TPA: polyprenyl synthetase family protein, partial [Actinomycetes bacterium]|nr:polyprenyl synthetase family protein [Actinomycetes bacterium]